MRASVFDPRTALRYAALIAGLLLTTEAVNTEAGAQGFGARGAGGGGMEGMY